MVIHTHHVSPPAHAMTTFLRKRSLLDRISNGRFFSSKLDRSTLKTVVTIGFPYQKSLDRISLLETFVPGSDFSFGGGGLTKQGIGGGACMKLWRAPEFMQYQVHERILHSDAPIAVGAFSLCDRQPRPSCTSGWPMLRTMQHAQCSTPMCNQAP